MLNDHDLRTCSWTTFTRTGIRGRGTAWWVKELCNLQHFGAVLVPPILHHLVRIHAGRIEPRMSAFAMGRKKIAKIDAFGRHRRKIEQTKLY